MPPRPDLWRHHFPVGVWIASQEALQRVPGNSVNTTSANPGVQSSWERILNHPEQGLRSNHLNYSLLAGAQPYNWEDVQGIAGWLDADGSGPMHLHYMGITGRTDAVDPNTGIDGDWYQRASENQTYADALTFAAPIVANFQEHPSMLGYHFGDDITVGNHGQASMTLARAIQDLDPYGRPALCTVTDGNVWALPDSEYTKIALSYAYPCGKTTSGAFALEGDFHRNTFSAIADQGGGGGDWVDLLRLKMTELPVGCDRLFLALQNHGTRDDPASLRPPTARELRKQFWIAIGEGITGLFWFPYDGSLDADASLSANSWGIGDIHEVAKMQVAGELSARLTPEMRRILLRCTGVADLFTTVGGGSAIYPKNYAAAYKRTLQDDLGNYYLVLCNHALSRTWIEVLSDTLTGTLVNMTTGESFPVGGAVELDALDGGMYRFVAGDGIKPLVAAMETASDNAVLGCAWLRDNGLALTGVAGNGSFDYHVGTATVQILDPGGGGAPVDDHDGNYGEAHKLHGLCLKYVRTHDAGLIPDIEAQVQWHIDIEQAAVAAWGAPFAGSAPYWYWTSDTLSRTESVGAVFGSTDLEVTYTQGMVRRWTSVDQMHMVGHGMYAYRYMLRNEPAITANTTLWDAAAAYISRMATFEANNYPEHARSVGNLNRIIQGLTPLTANGLTEVGYGSTYKGEIFDDWQVTNVTTPINPSSNSTIDVFFSSVWSPDGTVQGAINFLRGRAMDMLLSDMGQHDLTWDPVYAGVPGPYPTGWVLRASLGGDGLLYESPRVSASNSGFADDLHIAHIGDTSARDGLSGRAPQRLIVLCLLALLDPTYCVPTELDASGKVMRSVPIRVACDQWAETMAAHLPEPTTNCQRFMAPKYLGETGSHNPNVIDSAFTGYWMMASELWHMVNAGANYADYYPIGTW